MSSVMTNFKKNMNIFAISMKLFINDKVMKIINEMKLIHKLI